MNKIKFIDLSWKNKINLLILIPTFILLIFLFLDMFEVFSFQNDKLNKLNFFLIFAFQFIFYGRIFFFKNAIAYNKGGFNIRVNKFLPSTIAFADVSRINFQDEKFIITKFGGKRIELNLSNILEIDKIRLKDLLKSHINFV